MSSGYNQSQFASLPYYNNPKVYKASNQGVASTQTNMGPPPPPLLSMATFSGFSGPTTWGRKGGKYKRRTHRVGRRSKKRCGKNKRTRRR